MSWKKDVLRLWRLGWPVSRIARKLGADEGDVRSFVVAEWRKDRCLGRRESRYRGKGN